MKPILPRIGVLLIAALGLPAGASSLSDSEVQFAHYDALSSNVIMAQRLEPPLQVDLAFRAMAQHNQRLADQALDLKSEPSAFSFPPASLRPAMA